MSSAHLIQIVRYRVNFGTFNCGLPKNPSVLSSLNNLFQSAQGPKPDMRLIISKPAIKSYMSHLCVTYFTSGWRDLSFGNVNLPSQIST